MVMLILIKSNLRIVWQVFIQIKLVAVLKTPKQNKTEQIS